MSSFFALFKKELLLEVRGKEMLLVLFSMTIMLSVISASGVASAFLEPKAMLRIFPTFLWLVTFFSGVVASMRAHEAEHERGALEGLLLVGVGSGTLFCTKTFATFFVLLIGYLVAFFSLAILLNVPLVERFTLFLGVGCVVLFGFSCLMVLLGAVSSTSRLKGVVLPILILPLAIPFFWAGSELSQILIAAPKEIFNSSWLSLVVVADVLYFLLGFNLYGFAVEGE